MPSHALVNWQTFGLIRLGEIEQQCSTSVTTGPSGLAEENLRGYVMHLSAHFQKVCRDLYSECVQALLVVVPQGAQHALQLQAMSDIQLLVGNPKYETICHDFDRFGVAIRDELKADPANALRITHLGQLNTWRNYCAHRKQIPPVGAGGPLTIRQIHTWQDSCNGLVTSIDGIMYNELTKLTGSRPW